MGRRALVWVCDPFLIPLTHEPMTDAPCSTFCGITVRYYYWLHYGLLCYFLTENTYWIIDFCGQTKDEDGKADKEMDFNDEYGQDTGDGETFEGGYDYPDYNYDGYGVGAYGDYDGVDF